MKREIIQQTYTYRSCDKHILQAKCLKGWCTCSTWSRRFLKFSLRYVSTLVMMPSSLILSFSNCLLSCKWIKTSKHKSYLCDIFTVLKYQWFDIWMGFSCFVYHIKEISCMKWCCQSDGCVRSDSHLSKSQFCSFCLYKHPDNPKMRATLTVQSTQNTIC